jgi:hypothetical protein
LYTSSSSDIANSYTNSQPSTYDFLKPNGFRLVIKDIPNVAYTCQGVTLPEITTPYILRATPAINVHFPGSTPIFGDFSVNFIVSENMQNYIELYDWILTMTNTDDVVASQVLAKRLSRFPGVHENDNVRYSDATLFILNSANTPKIAIKFTDLFPVTLSPLTFDTTVDNIQYFVCGATFRYQIFQIEAL